ncbi:uncharacterized protein [Procambarus clarkii]|uniref:uncharacterized protein n=1 Tax=Procambarus clarkii TaxID=6728 RepID=UPI001E676D8C|nr:uncharacterized protein LOC123767551 [Procambarus clarkii]
MMSVAQTPASSMWRWFSMAREAGGPTYYPLQQLPYPAFAWHIQTALSIIVFLVPIIPFVFLLLSSRQKHWPSFIVVLLCFLTGFVLTVVFGSSWWMVGQAEVVMSVGPLRPPVGGTMGVLAGLAHVNLTYITPTFSLNEMVSWTTQMDLMLAHRRALRAGWPWGLLCLTAELGGESRAWRGSLGDGLREAGLITSSLLVAAMYVWGIWVVLFTVAPELTALPLMLTGLLMALASLTYVVCIGAHIPSKLMVSGTSMELQLGLSWWLTTVTGIILTAAGCGLFLYDAKYPGYLSLYFEMDFGTESRRLFPPSWDHTETLLAYTSPDTSSRGYSTFYLNSKQTSPKKVVDNNAYYTPDENNNYQLNYNAMTYNPNQGTDVMLKENGIISFYYERTVPGPSQSFGRGPMMTNCESITQGAGSLAHHQQHTPLTNNPNTLRRRSPEVTGPSQLMLPLFCTTPKSHEPVNPRHSQGLSLHSRPSFLVRSGRKSFKQLMSRDNSKFSPRNYPKASLISCRKTSRFLSSSASEQVLERSQQDTIAKELMQSSTLF